MPHTSPELVRDSVQCTGLSFSLPNIRARTSTGLTTSIQKSDVNGIRMTHVCVAMCAHAHLCVYVCMCVLLGVEIRASFILAIHSSMYLDPSTSS